MNDEIVRTSLKDLKWDRGDTGLWLGTVGGYQAIIRTCVMFETWEAFCTFRGEMFHRSEHESRGEAAAEAVVAIMRAIDIRERTAP